MNTRHNSYLQTPEIALRAVETNDLEILYQWENNTEWWHIGCTTTPFSREILREYIANAHLDIFSVKQLRLMIDSTSDATTVGMIDLYDFDPLHSRAGLAIAIEKKFCGRHFAQQAIECMMRYCKEILLLHQIFAEVPESNTASIALFRSCGFTHSGTKTAWLKRAQGYENVRLFQKIL